ncbi:hypothetical protein FIU84_03170 [Stutzerimonas frequens]|uniref:lecithin retinol acyltransferase family protein n=1 Tax=Stutzerimonas frequens TaxID=2968969 RepID=UPI0012697017|nr:lecithin retinol acyltransferase family protein [Stutzerimonas frequens]QFU11003.1 hypothetical protein FIU84_03170 [Stutzerimonas frequens]
MIDIIKLLLSSGISPTQTTNMPTAYGLHKRLKVKDSQCRSGFRAFLDEVTDRQPLLMPGCIVACDLMGGFADHSGIYIGRRRIIEKDGAGEIKRVSLHDFMNSSPLRTGISLFVACRNGKPIRRTEISKRAKEMEGTGRKYDLLIDNCHKLTAYCATGEVGEKNKIWTFESLVDALEEEFGAIEWRSVSYRNI